MDTGRGRVVNLVDMASAECTPRRWALPSSARTAALRGIAGLVMPISGVLAATPLAAQRPADSSAVRFVSPATIPLRPSGTATVRTSPTGAAIGSVTAQATVIPLARERGWVRVRMEGWVREQDLLPVDSTLRTALSAADLRADPEGSKGKLVRWKVEVLAFQRADALRRDLTSGEPYLLARGPAGENALLYLALPAAMVAEASAITPLTVVQVTARVRTGRSAPTNVPILDVEALTLP